MGVLALCNKTHEVANINKGRAIDTPSVVSFQCFGSVSLCLLGSWYVMVESWATDLFTQSDQVAMAETGRG